MKSHYIVADRHFSIEYSDEEVLTLMQRRYGPFRVSSSKVGDTPVMFALRVAPKFSPLKGAQLMSRFECEGSDCVYEQTEEMISISLLEPESDHIWAQMLCDVDFKKANCWLSGDVVKREYCINNFLMMLFAFASMATETLLFHASVIGHEGKAYLFLGKSGTGKSTHSRLWFDHIPNCELVNDDNPAVGLRDGKIIVYGTPWSGKTPCYRNVSFPVGAFVRLSQEKENTIERESIVRSFASLPPSCSGVKWDTRLYRAQGDTLSAIIARVPVYHLGCLPDAEAARLCHATVTGGTSA